MINDQSLETEILREIIYFDLFDYPLTTLEVWRNLRIKTPYREVERALRESAGLKERIECTQGVWGLKGRKGERAPRYRASKHKLDRARRFARLARWVPGIQAIYCCNTLGFLASQPKSDIDLLVVTQRGRIWTARFFLVALAKLFGRPRLGHTQDAICLSFFAVAGADMRKVALPEDDVYYEHWLKNLLPIFKSPPKLRLWRSFRRVNISEKLLRWVQLKILPAHLKALANQGTSVVLSDEFLKFHDHDKREYFRAELAKRVAAISK